MCSLSISVRVRVRLWYSLCSTFLLSCLLLPGVLIVRISYMETNFLALLLTNHYDFQILNTVQTF